MSGANFSFPLQTTPAVKGSATSKIVGGPLSFYGVGAAFPLRLNTADAGYQVLAEEALVNASIDTILNTHVSERPLLTKNGRPFGTRIRNYLFANLDDAAPVIALEAKQALDTWEPRIVVTNVVCGQTRASSGSVVLNVVIFFRYRSTDRADNKVVSFYTR